MRLFVAIDLPEEVRQNVWGLYSELPAAHWVDRQQLHLTLRFIGEADDKTFGQLKEALASVRSTPFPLALTGLGTFPGGQPRVLWVGIEENEPLRLLQENVEMAVIAGGGAPEHRPFSPHITIARFKDPPPRGLLASYLDRNRDFRCEPFSVCQIHLYSSTLTGRGAIHKLEETFTL